jgi:putative colanic acid biosynthesis acetyltransferase WcaF
VPSTILGGGLPANQKSGFGRILGGDGGCPGYITNVTPLYQRLDRENYRPYSMSEYAGMLLWELTQATSNWVLPRRAFGTRRLLLRLFGAGIGPSAKVCRGVRIKFPGLLSIGAYSVIGEGTEIYNLGKVSIGSHTVVSQRAYLCAGTHDLTHISRPLVRAEISVGDGVWICANAFIGPSVSIGDNAVVGACAVVVRSVEATCTVAGNPARVVGRRRVPYDLMEGEGPP